MKLRTFKEYDDRYLDTSSIANKFLNISYSNNHSRCQLDIYLPDKLDESKTYPVIIFFHGGAFLKGDKGRYQLNSALQGIEEGFAVVSVNYRLLPEFWHKDYLTDAKMAVDYIYRHGKEYQLDVSKLFLWGESAGAFLALSVGLTSLDNRLTDYLNMTNTEKYPIKGIISWYAPTNLIEHPDMKVLDGQSLNELKYHQTGTELEQTLSKLSAINLVSENRPNLLIQHGTNDEVVAPKQAVDLAQAASECINDKEIILDMIVGANHTTEFFGKPKNVSRIFTKIKEWENKTTKGENKNYGE